MSVAEMKQAKLSLIAWIEQLSDTNMLSLLEGLKNSRSDKDWWDDLNDTQIANINQGLSDIENGRVMSSEDFWNKLKDA